MAQGTFTLKLQKHIMVRVCQKHYCQILVVTKIVIQAKMMKKRLGDVPFVNYNSDVDDEREEVREKVRRYVQLKKIIEDYDVEGDNEDRDGGQLISTEDVTIRDIVAHQDVEGGKVNGYESKYIDSSDPGSHDGTSEGSNANNAKRNKSKDKYYGSLFP